MSFWDTLPKPFFALAPMADVTDPAFRELIADIKAPNITWTEFVSADGLFHTREKGIMTDAENPLVRDLAFTEGERPILAQFFGSNPATMEYAAAFAKERGFDGVDINMGCPDASIEKQGAGAAHMKNPARAKEVIRAALRGANGLPVSVKTRLGFNRMEWQEWLPHILEENISALTLHLRTRKEMSKVPAHWELARELNDFVRARRPDIQLLGNGDVTNLEDARMKAGESGFDGIMLGRAIFGNPWLFTGKKMDDISREEKLAVLMKLAYGFDTLRPRKSFHILKKHFKAFVNGFDGAAELRARMMETNDVETLEVVVKHAQGAV
jgi:nifR3 family TIM-barrel protein